MTEMTEVAEMAEMAEVAELTELTELTVSSPAAGSTYLIDPTLKPEFQSLALRTRGAVGRVEWFVNSRPVGVSLGDGSLSWPLTRGSHTITARDANGRAADARIVVR